MSLIETKLYFNAGEIEYSISRVRDCVGRDACAAVCLIVQSVVYKHLYCGLGRRWGDTRMRS